MSTHARRGRYLAVAGVVLAVAGVLTFTTALQGQQDAPGPPASAASAVPLSPAPSSAAAPSVSPSTSDRATGPILAASQPTALSIPAIGVRSKIGVLGLNPDQTVEVPPLGKDSYAGWYKYSPSPGQLGPSILLGHIDSAQYGPGVFFKLGALRPRDTVSISRSDGTVAVFRVERVVEYPKAHFPTAEVYGNTDRAALRLITCGGKFDPSVRSYEDNIVAYASLVSSHHA
jgi:Sortase domain